MEKLEHLHSESFHSHIPTITPKSRMMCTLQHEKRLLQKLKQDLYFDERSDYNG
jgi:hypothetical protein